MSEREHHLTNNYAEGCTCVICMEWEKQRKRSVDRLLVSIKDDYGAAAPFEGVSDAEARSIIRVVLANGDFAEADYTDALNDAIDVCFRALARMNVSDGELSQRTRDALRWRQSRSQP